LLIDDLEKSDGVPPVLGSAGPRKVARLFASGATALKSSKAVSQQILKVKGAS
jgi:hypothetical protein